MSNPTTPGWHRHPNYPGKWGYWDGRRWDDDLRDAPPDSGPGPRSPARSGGPVSPWTVLLAGAGLIVLAVLLAFVSGDSGAGVALVYLVGGVGGVVASIGTAAVGALIAIRYRDHHRS